jgi:lipid A 4'-phosphatase
MHYLRLRRSRIILASFVLFAVFMTAFPRVDIAISSVFYDGKLFLLNHRWQILLQRGLTCFIALSVTAVLVIYSCNRLLGRNVCGVDGRRVLFLVLVLAIGAGFVVNFALKDHFGRARPRDIAEFGGTKQFTPAFQVARQCNKNCSFSSGDAAGGFFSLALALALSRRRAAFVAGLAVGVLMSFARISAGAHFFSDTVVSFFVMLIVADVLFYHLVATRPSLDEAGIPVGPLRPVHLASAVQVSRSA